MTYGNPHKEGAEKGQIASKLCSSLIKKTKTSGKFHTLSPDYGFSLRRARAWVLSGSSQTSSQKALRHFPHSFDVNIEHLLRAKRLISEEQGYQIVGSGGKRNPHKCLLEKVKFRVQEQSSHWVQSAGAGFNFGIKRQPQFLKINVTTRALGKMKHPYGHNARGSVFDNEMYHDNYFGKVISSKMKPHKVIVDSSLI